MIQTLTQRPDLATVELFEAGVEPDNHASRRALQTAGLTLRTDEPDYEEMLYYQTWKPATH